MAVASLRRKRQENKLRRLFDLESAQTERAGNANKMLYRAVPRILERRRWERDKEEPICRQHAGVRREGEHVPATPRVALEIQH